MKKLYFIYCILLVFGISFFAYSNILAKQIKEKQRLIDKITPLYFNYINTLNTVNNDIFSPLFNFKSGYKITSLNYKNETRTAFVCILTDEEFQKIKPYLNRTVDLVWSNSDNTTQVKLTK